jgi:hypothetical protein
VNLEPKLKQTSLICLMYSSAIVGIDVQLGIERAGRDIANERGDGEESARRSAAIEDLKNLRAMLKDISPLQIAKDQVDR